MEIVLNFFMSATQVKLDKLSQGAAFDAISSYIKFSKI